MKTLGFIGLGTMGGHMAANLARSGHPLIVHDTRKEPAQRIINAGASWAETVADVATKADIIFTSLPGPTEFESAILANDGMLAHVRPGMVHFDLTTNSLAMVRRAETCFSARGAKFLDAPVSGGPSGAESGKLAFWISGDRQAFDENETIIRNIGDEIKYVGPIGAGTIAKLVHNAMGYIINTGIAEVFSMGVKAGVDPLDLWEAVREGAIGRRRVFDHLPLQFLSSKYQPARFALKLAHKDVGLAAALGKEVGVPMRLTNMVLEELTECLNKGWGDWDSKSHMLLQLERSNVAIAVEQSRLEAAVAAAAK